MTLVTGEHTPIPADSNQSSNNRLILGFNSNIRSVSSSTSIMSLEREIKHNDWRESFKKVETKVCTSDRFTRLTNNASLQRPNSSLNR